MPINSLVTVFGTNATFATATKQITIDLNDLKNDADGGEILNGIGIDDVSVIDDTNIDDWAVRIFYGLMLIASQNQSLAINDDATEKMYLTESGLRIGTGTRQGQIQRLLTANFFDTNTNLTNTVDIDDL